MAKNKLNGIFNAEVKKMFSRQWVNGDIQKFMQSVKRRVSEMYGINLTFKTQDEFLDELIKHELLTVYVK